MDICVKCGKEIPPPAFEFGGRTNGKTKMLFYYNIRQICCSDACFAEVIELVEKIQEELYG